MNKDFLLQNVMKIFLKRKTIEIQMLWCMNSVRILLYIPQKLNKLTYDVHIKSVTGVVVLGMVSMCYFELSDTTSSTL